MCLKVLRGEINRQGRDWGGVLRSILKSKENFFKEILLTPGKCKSQGRKVTVYIIDQPCLKNVNTNYGSNINYKDDGGWRSEHECGEIREEATRQEVNLDLQQYKVNG